MHLNQELRSELQALSGWRIPGHDVLGYLLRKLPQFMSFGEYDTRLTITPQAYKPKTSKRSSNWCAAYVDIGSYIKFLQVADTPEDALCALSIELFKKGILTKEGV